MAEFTTIDEYLAALPADVRPVIEQIRRTLHAAVPDAGEKIAYQMPTLTLDGQSLVHFSGWKQHVSLYPVPPVDDELAAAIAPYVAGKGTLKFPLNQAIPYDLISRLAKAYVDSR
jgi:uncharacterized protein YdhG (YjbR/CyaY superfamily)